MTHGQALIVIVLLLLIVILQAAHLAYVAWGGWPAVGVILFGLYFVWNLVERVNKESQNP